MLTLSIVQFVQKLSASHTVQLSSHYLQIPVVSLKNPTGHLSKQRPSYLEGVKEVLLKMNNAVSLLHFVQLIALSLHSVH